MNNTFFFLILRHLGASMVSLLQFGNNNTNNMNSSLKRSLEEDSGASLINVVSGEKHEIKIVDEPVSIFYIVMKLNVGK